MLNINLSDFVSRLEQVAMPSVLPVEILGITLVYAMHYPTNISTAAVYYQMGMGVHDAVGIYLKKIDILVPLYDAKKLIFVGITLIEEGIAHELSRVPTPPSFRSFLLKKGELPIYLT